MNIVKVTGINTVIRNLTRKTADIERGVARGLKKGGLFLQRESQKIVPVDLGNLYASADTRNVGGTGFRTDIVVAYGQNADYAVFVHEDMNKRHGRAYNEAYGAGLRGEDQQAKFLEKPARERKREIIRIIHREAKR